MGSSSKPKEDPAAIALRKRQVRQSMELDADENRKIKQVFLNSLGTRVFTGSADARLTAKEPFDDGLTTSKAPGLRTKSGKPGGRGRKGGNRYDPSSGLREALAYERAQKRAEKEDKANAAPVLSGSQSTVFNETTRRKVAPSVIPSRI